MTKRDEPFLWGNLIHLSYNLWGDRPMMSYLPDLFRYRNLGDYIMNYRKLHGDGILETLSITGAKPYLRFDDAVWDVLVEAMAAAGINLVVLDLGDAVRYRSHPEIAVKNAWSTDRLRDEVARLRAAGIEAVPKLNFSACHDIWLGDYSRRLSTPEYYAVCRDLIEEACDLFDSPRLLHLGMDEELFATQSSERYVVLRQYDLWWHDLQFFFDCVERCGARPWIWGDGMWNKIWAREAKWHMIDEFRERVPRSVLISSWYYGKNFEPDDFQTEDELRAREGHLAILDAYRLIDEAGYDQIPTVSNITATANLAKSMAYCARVIHPDRLKGYLMTTWASTLPEQQEFHLEAIRLVAAARAAKGE